MKKASLWQGKVYVPGTKLKESFPTAPEGQTDGYEEAEKSSKLPSQSTKPSSKSTNLNGQSTKLTEKAESLSDGLKGRIAALRKKEDRDVVLDLIEAICREVTMSTEELAVLLRRNHKSLYRDYISALLQEGRLFRVNPQTKTDPNQAYTSSKPAEGGV